MGLRDKNSCWERKLVLQECSVKSCRGPELHISFELPMQEFGEEVF